jgi:hypothetical protein
MQAGCEHPYQHQASVDYQKFRCVVAVCAILKHNLHLKLEAVLLILMEKTASNKQMLFVILETYFIFVEPMAFILH